MLDRLGVTLLESAASVYERDDVVREYAAVKGLKDAEPAILERVRRAGPGVRLLDLGVGAGRTSHYFAPLAAEYVAIDPSEAMIGACRDRFAVHGWSHVRFAVGDARELSRFRDASFDVVLFSWNGLDDVGGLGDRLQALREIHRVCRPGALFAFSTRNLNWVPARLSFRSAFAAGTTRTGFRSLVRTAAWRLLNPRAFRIARMQGLLVTDERHGLTWTNHYYIRPTEQLRQLREIGFLDPAALSQEGRELTEEEAATDERQWLYYICTR